MNDGDDSVFGVKHFLVFHDFRMKTNFDKSVDHKPDYAQEDKGYDLMSKIMGKVKGLVKAFEHLVQWHYINNNCCYKCLLFSLN